MIPIEELNKEVRDLFNHWHLDAMKPQKNLIAERIGIGYVLLKQFSTGRDITYQNLTIIMNYLEKQGYKLKQKA